MGSLDNCTGHIVCDSSHARVAVCGVGEWLFLLIAPRVLLDDGLATDAAIQRIPPFGG